MTGRKIYENSSVHPCRDDDEEDDNNDRFYWIPVSVASFTHSLTHYGYSLQGTSQNGAGSRHQFVSPLPVSISAAPVSTFSLIDSLDAQLLFLVLSFKEIHK